MVTPTASKRLAELWATLPVPPAGVIDLDRGAARGWVRFVIYGTILIHDRPSSHAEELASR
jgi:hypothetical protein